MRSLPAAMTMTQAKWWAAGLLLPSLLLSTHVARRSANDLSPWKGGAFGMFSTLDAPWRRDVRVRLTLEGGRERPLSVYIDALQEAVDIVAVEPSEANLRALGARVFSGCIVEHPDTRFHRSCPEGSNPLRLSAIEIGVWRPEYEPKRSTLRLVPLRSIQLVAEEVSGDSNPR